MAGLFAEALRAPEERQLTALRGPVLVVRGARDPVAGAAWCERVRELVPQGRLVVIPGCAHAVNYSAPVLLAEAIRSFVAEAGVTGVSRITGSIGDTRAQVSSAQVSSADSSPITWTAASSALAAPPSMPAS